MAAVRVKMEERERPHHRGRIKARRTPPARPRPFGSLEGCRKASRPLSRACLLGGRESGRASEFNGRHTTRDGRTDDGCKSNSGRKDDGKARLPDGDRPILRLFAFGPSGLKDYGYATKFDPVLSLVAPG